MLILAGCSSFQKTTQKIGQDLSGSGNLKKRLVCLPFENRTGFEKERPQGLFLQNLTDQLQNKCPALTLEPSEKGFKYSDFALPPPSASGKIDMLMLSDAFRQKGINVLLMGSILDISAGVEKRGLLWFKEDRYIFKAHIEIMLIDTQTGTRISDEDFFYEAEVDEKEFNIIRSGKGADSAHLKPALLAMSQEAVKIVCQALDALPWFCTVEAVQKNKVILSCGKKSGLREGIFLNVYEKGNAVAGFSGQRYFLKGRKTGRIKVTDVSGDQAEAISTSDSPIAVGDIVSN
ncbi:MAG: hypothetical protein AB1659_00410 [Thermodesulfobacteriota bacterium]